MIVVSNYILLNCHHLLRSYAQTYKLKIDQDRIVFTMFPALLVPVPLSCVMSNFRVTVLACLSRSSENRYPAGKSIRKISFRTREHLRTAGYRCTRKRIQAFYGNQVCQNSAYCGNLLGFSAESSWRFQLLRAFQN